ncbi:MAG: hypothetical protein ACXVCY_06695 [Pseudobdellovibrionaceae bacterium]
MKKTIISSSVLLLLLSGCSEQKKLDEMHDATLKMQKTTEQMGDNTSQMKQKTESLENLTRDMKETTKSLEELTRDMKGKTQSLETLTHDVKDISEELYDALRQGNSLQLRREAYKAVLAAPTLAKKVSEATKYFMSFEMQLWNDLGQDRDADKREILKQQAAMEFFLEIEELAPRDGSVNPTSKPDAENLSYLNSDANLSASFNAMAVSMHQVNRKQVQSLKEISSAKEISMYSIMEEALLLPRNQAQPYGAAREVLAHESKAIQLLQSRYNTFQMIFIDAVSGIGEKGFFDQAKMALMSWDFDADSLSATKTEYLVTEVLTHAVSAKNLLVKTGHQPVLDATVAKLMKNMNVKISGKGGPGLVSQQTKMMELLQELRK